jgi:hypothetical protein
MHRFYLFALALATLAALTGCGAAPDVPEEYAGELVELGQLEQPVWAANGYGVDSRQRRCIASRGWGPDSRCDMPRAKHAMIGTPIDSGCNQAQIGEIYLALAQLQIVSVAAGWQIATPQPGAMGTWSDSQIFYDDVWPIRCTAIAGDTLARTRPWQLPVYNYTCHDVTLIGVPVCAGCRYEVCKYQQGFIDVDYQKLNTLPAAGMTVSQKHAMRLNYLKHEFYHVMGLGHEPDATSPTLLMAKGGQTINGTFLTTSWAAPMAPTAHESWLLRSYNPNGDTPNP